VCVAGVSVRENWAGLLLPGGLRRKERFYESVCVLEGVNGSRGCGFGVRWRSKFLLVR
jgi:hypothetical protein